MKKNFLLILSILFITNTLFATDGSKLWTSISYSHKISDKIFISMKEEVRFIGASANVGDLFSEEDCELNKVRFNAGIGYKINKIFKISAVARFNAEEPKYNNTVGIEKQFLLNMYAKYNLPYKLKFSYRMRYQNILREDNDNKEYLRNKFIIQWNKNKRYKPFLGIEGFYRFSYDKGDRFSEVRYIAGLEFDLPSSVLLDLYYIYQDEANMKNLLDAHIIGIALKFD